MTVTLDSDRLERLASLAPSAPVLSVYMRTDPRDPANNGPSPAWHTELSNGLGEITDELEQGDDRDARLGFRDLRERLLSEVRGLVPSSTGRSLAWFVSLDGSLDERYTLQLPLRSSLVRLDSRPFVSPLVDVVDRGEPAGIVVVDEERVRVLEYAHGAVDEDTDLELDVDSSDWRRYDGAAASSRSSRGATHTDQVAARVEAHRDRFIRSAADAVAQRIQESGWSRVVVVAPGGMAARFHLELPAPARDRVRLDLDLNLQGLAAVDVAERVERHVDALHHDDALAMADDLRDAGPAAAIGPAAVFAALAKGQVETLVVDPLHAPDGGALPDLAQDVVGDAPPDYLAERAVEAAIASSARVTSVAVSESPALAAADGMLAGLRW